VVLERLGRHDEAETQFRQAIADGDLRAHLNLGNLVERAGDLEQAEAEYRRAMDAGVPGSWADLALLREWDVPARQRPL
jgi:Tfp pilus assembly protein PilF